MLSFNRIRFVAKILACSAVIGFGVSLTACTVQPLYSGQSQDGEPGLNVAPNMRTKLASIAVDTPNDRETQIVRNRLIFLMTGGAGQSTTPTYKLALNTSVSVLAAVRVDIGDRTDRTGRASAGIVTAHANYVLKDKDGNVVAKRRRSISSSFDRPRQEYANLQAEENAKKRAAEELAEQIFLSLAQDLSKH